MVSGEEFGAVKFVVVAPRFSEAFEGMALGLMVGTVGAVKDGDGVYGTAPDSLSKVGAEVLAGAGAGLVVVAVATISGLVWACAARGNSVALTNSNAATAASRRRILAARFFMMDLLTDELFVTLACFGPRPLASSLLTPRNP
jgi:hypothetical protein